MKNKKYSNFEWQIPQVIASLPKGNDAKKLFEASQKEAKTFPKIAQPQLNVLKYNPDSKELYNSNVFVVGLLNKLLSESNLRVSVPGDDFNGDIYRLIKDKHYTDFNALVCQEKIPRYEKNKNLWKKVMELAEEKQGKVKFPFMIQGFYIAPDKTEENYGVKIIPASNFEIIEDERFSGKYNCWKFDSLDKKGIPLSLDKTNGSRTFYTREDGLSRFDLDRCSGLGSWYGDLAYSYDDGRVVLVSAESKSKIFMDLQNVNQGANAKNLDKNIANLQRERDNQISKINTKYEKTLKILKS